MTDSAEPTPIDDPGAPNRRRVPADTIRLASIVLLVVGIFLGMGSLPVGLGIEKMQSWLRSLGTVGPVVYGGIYVLAALLMVPGSTLTLAAGALFGLQVGTAVVSLASTMSAAVALLIARYLVHERITSKLETYPKFDTIDRAIVTGGWRLVALLRLSPAVPFNLQNYLYGLTRIPFWTCVLTSWITMLPGTVMYVFLGRAAVDAARVSSEGVGDTGKMILLLAGLAATVAGAIYIAKLAKRELERQIDSDQKRDPTMPRQPVTGKQPTLNCRLIAFATLSVAVFSGCVVARLNKPAVESWVLSFFRPPSRVLNEVYDEKPSGEIIDHTVLDELLKKHVDAGGFVDYADLENNVEKLDTYIALLASTNLENLGRNELLALYINAYNAFTLKVVVDHYPAIAELENVQDILADAWDEKKWIIGGKIWSLTGIEHDELRDNFREPRIHFALVCAAIGCPPLRNEAYIGSRIEEQLRSQMEYVHTHGTWVRYDAKSNVVHLTEIYDWYGSDFLFVSPSVLEYVANLVPAVRQAVDAGKEPRIELLPYSWRLNDSRFVDSAPR